MSEHKKLTAAIVQDDAWVHKTKVVHLSGHVTGDKEYEVLTYDHGRFVPESEYQQWQQDKEKAAKWDALTEQLANLMYSQPSSTPCDSGLGKVLRNDV